MSHWPAIALRGTVAALGIAVALLSTAHAQNSNLVTTGNLSVSWQAEAGVLCALRNSDRLDEIAYERGDRYKALSCADYRAALEKWRASNPQERWMGSLCWLLDPCASSNVGRPR